MVSNEPNNTTEAIQRHSALQSRVVDMIVRQLLLLGLTKTELISTGTVQPLWQSRLVHRLRETWWKEMSRGLGLCLRRCSASPVARRHTALLGSFDTRRGWVRHDAPTCADTWVGSTRVTEDTWCSFSSSCQDVHSFVVVLALTLPPPSTSGEARVLLLSTGRLPNGLPPIYRVDEHGLLSRQKGS